jgi:TetR/AcrR family transcriptional repressor of nem operon
MPSDSATRDQLLDAAQEFCQTRGYNAFSYRDLADRVGIRSASIHYHFPTKSDLGKALLQRYRVTLANALKSISEQADTAPARLERMITLMLDVLGDGQRMCLGGMLATEQVTLPSGMQREVRSFFDDAETWLTDVMAEGRKQRELDFDGRPATAARTFLAALEGAMMAARASGEPARLADAGRWLIRNLASPR